MSSEPQYLPVEERVVDTQYKDCLRKIWKEGVLVKHANQTEGRYVSVTIPNMIYYFSNGFPILTERKAVFWRKPIQELFAFINGVHDARVLAEEWGVNWWKESWATPEKCADFHLPPYEMGPGSYGPAFNPRYFVWEMVENHTDGGRWVPHVFRQFEHLIQEIKDRPDLATHKVTTWIPQLCLQHRGLKRQVVVAPCHGDVEVKILQGKLTLRMDQRSDDFPIGHPSNMIQYAALTLAIAHVTGYEPYCFIHSPHDAQIYERHMEEVEEILGRESHRLPTMRLTEEGKKLTDIFDFRAKHFELSEYEAGPAMQLKGAVV